MFFIYTIILGILMKKSYLLIVALLINSVFVKACDNNSNIILGRVAVTAATLALGHVLYSQEKDGAEQRAKGHVFTATSGKDGRIAIPGEDALFRKAVDKATDVGLYAGVAGAAAITLPGILLTLPVYGACQAGICSKMTYVATVGLGTVCTTGLWVVPPIALAGGSVLAKDFMFKTPSNKLKEEYIAANPSEYLKQVKANHDWFGGNFSDKDTVLWGLSRCSNRKYRTAREENFCSDMRDLEKYIVNGKKS